MNAERATGVDPSHPPIPIFMGMAGMTAACFLLVSMSKPNSNGSGSNQPFSWVRLTQVTEPNRKIFKHQTHEIHRLFQRPSLEKRFPANHKPCMFHSNS